MTILNKILQEKRREVEKMLKEQVVVREQPTRPSLFDRLYQTKKLQIISEIKRASPSKGLINEGVNPVEQALQYEQAGAACISVLTDAPFFKGSFDDLAAVADNVGLPILCKDFIIHSAQIDRAKNAGASVILLIVAALDDEELAELFSYATSRGLEVLVEVNSEEELRRALTTDAKLIGVNNRDLRTFEVDLKKTAQIAAQFPFDEERALISESGIWEEEDALFVAEKGASAVLVGESLMRSGNVKKAVQSLQVTVGAIQ